MTATADLRRAVLADEIERDRLDRAVRTGRSDLSAALAAATARAEATAAALDAAISAEDRIWPDDPHPLPAVLIPWRVEVRYLAGGAGPELGLRAVPDEIAVHTFEPELTDAERAAGIRYWTSVTAAGVTPEATNAAWLTILAELGLARAAWTVEALQPVGTAPDGAAIMGEAARRSGNWTRAATSLLLPERLSFRGWRHDRVVFDVVGGAIPDDLALGPDPTALGPRPDDAAPDDAAPDDPLLAWRGRSAWMVDFDVAVAQGMAVRVPLTGSDLAFDEIVVVGIADRPASDDSHRLGETIRGHLYTRGLALPAPGSPTNNTEATRAAWSSAPRPRSPDEVATALGAVRPASSQPGVVLAGALGFAVDSPTEAGRRELLLAPGAVDRDDAPLLRRARELASTTVSDGGFTAAPTALGWIDGTAARRHFISHVDVAGPLPALRVGRQPYGVLPVTSLTLWKPLPPPDDPPPENPPGFGGPDVIVTLPDRPHDVPGSTIALLRHLRAALAVQRAASPRLGGHGGQTDALFDLYRRQPHGVGLRVGAAGLRDAGGQRGVPAGGGVPLWDWDVTGIVELAAPGSPSLVDPTHGQVLARLRAIIDAFLQACPQWDGVGDPPVPAEVVEDYRAFFSGGGGAQLEDTAGGVFWALALPVVAWGALLGPGMITTRRQEELAGHTDRVATLSTAIDNMLVRFDVLTGWIPDVLADQGAVDHAFARAVEGLTTRVDAWWTSMATARLGTIRDAAPVGLHVGVYSAVTDVHPTPPASRKGAEGWVLTPSLHHAATTAVLHSGWEGREDPAAFAVDLTSGRVRRACDLLDGLRNGRTLEELLGYQLERDLHDALLDHLIPPMRAGHPLSSLVTASGSGLGPDLVPGLVADGDSVRRAGAELAAEVVASATPAELDAVRAIVARLDDTIDAVGDVLLAESVHQLVGGSPLRAGLTVDTVGHANPVPDRLDVLRTERRSVSVGHAVALATAGPPTGGGWAPSDRATLDPAAEAVAAWALGPTGDWTATLTAVDGTIATLSLADLGLAAIDVVADAEDPIDRSALAARIRVGRGDGVVAVRRSDGVGDGEALVVLCAGVRRLLAASRPATAPNELLEPVDQPSASVDVTGLAGRVTAWWDQVEAQLATWPDGTADQQAQAILRLAQLGVAGVRADTPPSAGDSLRTRWPASIAVPTGDLASASGPGLTAALGALRAAVAAVVGGWVVLAPEWTAPEVGPDVGPDTAWAALGGSPPSGAPFDDDDVEDWLHDHVDVRERVSTLADVLQSVMAFGAGRRRWLVRQSRPAPDRLGGGTIEGWSARDHPGPRSAMHLAALAIGDPATSGGGRALLTVDQWVETMPMAATDGDGTGVPDESAAMAFRFDRPDARAPQAVLIAVPPDPGRGWRLEDLHAAVDETLWWARVRPLDADDIPELRWVLP